MNVSHVKRMLYYQRGFFSGLELYASHDWRVMIQNKHYSHIVRRHFVSTFGHIIQIVGHILAFYIPNDLAAIGDTVS